MTVSLHFVERGERGAEAIVFLHGFPLDHTMWQHQLDALSAHYRCLAPDLRGFGSSPLPSEGSSWTMDDLADDVVALLDKLRIEQATFCGLSMGGYIAFALWRNHRGRIRRLILADTKATADTPQAKANRQRQAELVRAQGVAPLADEMVPKLLSPDKQATLSDSLRQMILRARPETVLAALPALAERPDMSERLGEITVPTLIVVGEDDALSPISDAQLMYDRLPNAQLVIIPSAGHMSPFEEPEAFNRAVLEFMRDF